MDLASNKVLITGIDSFTGKHLSTYLELSGYEVYGTSLFAEDKKIYQCDLTKKDDVVKLFEQLQPDFIIHLAGITFTQHENDEDFYRVNTIGTMNILDALLEFQIKPEKVILASSATVYGNLSKEVLDEGLCPSPANHYGASKYAMETLAKNYFESLNIIITRPFNYTGVGQEGHFLIPKIVQSFKEKKDTIELGNLDVIREFNDVNFVCEVYRKLCESKVQSEIINICSNRGVKLLDVIDIMNNISKYKIKVKVNPQFIRKNEIKTLTGSSKKLFEIIGDINQKTLENTLTEMYKASK